MHFQHLLIDCTIPTLYTELEHNKETGTKVIQHQLIICVKHMNITWWQLEDDQMTIFKLNMKGRTDKK